MTKVAIIGSGPCGLSMLRSFQQAEEKGEILNPDSVITWNSANPVGQATELSIMFEKSPDNSGFTVFTSSIIILPVEPSMVIISPSLTV